MPKRRSAGIVVSSLLLCRQRAPSLTGARSPRLRRRRGASLTAPRSPRLRRRRAASLRAALPSGRGFYHRVRGFVPHLAQNATIRQRRDALWTIAQDGLQDVLIIPPKRWPGV